MKSKIRFGILGCSSISKKSTIPAIIKSKNSTLEIIGSRSKNKAKKFAREFHCSKHGNYDEILESDDVDAVYISLPIRLHEEWAIKAAKSGKHILCEKSVVTSHSSAKKLLKICKNNDVRIMENFVFKHHPQHKKVSQLIKQNTIGDVQTFNGKFGFNLSDLKQNFRYEKKLGGGALNDVGCYLIAASKLIFQEMPISVFCDLKITEKSKVDMNGNMMLVFPNKKTALLSFGYDNYFQSTYEIWGRCGLLKVERAFNVPAKMKTSLKLFYNDRIKTINIKPVDQFQQTIEIFSNELKNFSTDRNFENDLLEQSLVMDYARKSFMKKAVIHINN